MDLGLDGRGVVVTGGSKGIGRAIALAFAAEGAHVAICARGEPALHRTRDDLQALGVTVHAATCDVADATALQGFLEGARAALGSVDVLVSNASGLTTADSEADWHSSFAIDMMAAVRATHTVLPWMHQAGSGSILYITSISGLEAGSPPAYAAIKAALFSYAKTLSATEAPNGVRVNTVAPGSIEFAGGVWERIREDNRPLYDVIKQSIPFGRLGQPDEVAPAAVFLASNAARWITGVTLVVDGGQHKGNL